ncbi:MAG: Thioesterase, partial [Bryobacterales bacterium]|nr:Thioesterase [Bryobacterales bacterium]
WGTNEADRRSLEQHPNIFILPAVDDIKTILARTRVLLVPSLWAEARSRIVVEAMLHGVPVIASEIGGIPEAKLGVDYLVRVRQIEKYRERVDDQMVPIAEVPEQDIEAWHNALNRLLSEPQHYEQLSRASREAALKYADHLSVQPFERLLEEAAQKPKRSRLAFGRPAATDSLAQLSPDKRHLLALRLRSTAPAAGSWFPSIKGAAEAQLRLFCFPFAGGGASAFRGWAEHLSPGVALVPARLPGRETRLAEPPFDSMEPLIEALAEAISPQLEKPFAFFGHSLGAVIAFELARWLQTRGRPLPRALFVSGARAPQFRRGHVPPPPPSDDELLQELKRLEGISRDLLDNQELLQLALPILRADTAIYRNYIYADAPPLDCDIRAYGGNDDRRITRSEIEAWSEQTTRSFSCEMFPGGHFFIRSHEAEFLKALSSDLSRITRS